MIDKICLSCQGPFRVLPSRIAQKYCSLPCYGKAISGKKLPHSTRHKISLGLMGRPVSQETRDRIANAQKGEKGNRWGKKHSLETKKKMSHSRMGREVSEETKRKLSQSNKGKHFDRKGKTYNEIYGPKKAAQIKAASSQRQRGQTLSAEHRKKISIALTGKKHSKAWFEKMVGRKLSKEHIKKSMRRRIPTSLEEKFMQIADEHSLPYAYVGDGSFLIENFNPDFVNTNGEKIAVEVYARIYKTMGERTIAGWKEKRSKAFLKYGWTIEFFDEIELTEQNVLTRLSEGIN